MTERIELPDRTLYFADFYDADTWITTHADARPNAVTEPWDGISADCLYDAATGLLLLRGSACAAGTSCPDVDWTRTALHHDFQDALRLLLVAALPSLAAIATTSPACHPASPAPNSPTRSSSPPTGKSHSRLPASSTYTAHRPDGVAGGAPPPHERGASHTRGDDLASNHGS